MPKIFIPFQKQSQGIEPPQRCINACSRESFTVVDITRGTYICALHWPGKIGPTDEFSDPLQLMKCLKHLVIQFLIP